MPARQRRRAPLCADPRSDDDGLQRPPHYLRGVLTHPHTRTPRGFTIVALLVGLVLLTIGLIGTAGTVAVLAYHSAASARAERATLAALHKIAALRAAGCVAQTGRTTDGPFTITWTVRVGSHSAAADVVVEYRERGATRSRSYDAGFLC